MKKISLLFTAVLAFAAISCGHKKIEYGNDNAVYYWRTTLTLDDNERQFIADNNINTIYLRYFDVSVNNHNEVQSDINLVPNATLRFVDSLPENVRVVPVVYITTDAAEAMGSNIEELARRIARRVNAMSEGNGIEYDEIQLDCDWTAETGLRYYTLCLKLKENLDPSVSLSSTIRLHQLNQTPPPVDRGVLMVYNTGSFKDINTRNSIFSLEDIEPYLRDRRLARYDLPLDVAYPAFGWSIAFNSAYWSNDNFEGILHQTDFSEYPEITHQTGNIYLVTDPVNTGECTLRSGNRIRVEIPSYQEIMAVKELIEDQLSNRPHRNIIYHLDSKQLSNFTQDEIKDIYGSSCR